VWAGAKKKAKKSTKKGFFGKTRSTLGENGIKSTNRSIEGGGKEGVESRRRKRRIRAKRWRLAKRGNWGDLTMGR